MEDTPIPLRPKRAPRLAVPAVILEDCVVQADLTAFKQEVMTTVSHEIQLLQTSVTEVMRRLDVLASQVTELASRRTEDADFIAGQKAEAARNLHEAELIDARAQERAKIVLEQQRIREAAETAAQSHHAATIEKSNKIFWLLLSGAVSLIVGLGIFLITGVGHQTGVSITLASGMIALLGLIAIVLATRIRT